MFLQGTSKMRGQIVVASLSSGSVIAFPFVCSNGNVALEASPGVHVYTLGASV